MRRGTLLAIAARALRLPGKGCRPPEPQSTRGSKARARAGAGPAVPPLQAPGHGPGGPSVLLAEAEAYFTQAQEPANTCPGTHSFLARDEGLVLGPGTLLRPDAGVCCPPAPPGPQAFSTPLRTGSCTRRLLCPSQLPCGLSPDLR